MTSTATSGRAADRVLIRFSRPAGAAAVPIEGVQAAGARPGSVAGEHCPSRTHAEIRLRSASKGAQPLTAPDVIPATICRLKNRNMISGGIVISRMFMNSRLYCVEYWLEKL